MRKRMPACDLTVKCATGTGGSASSLVIRNSRRIRDRINGPSTIANPAPGHTRLPAENGIYASRLHFAVFRVPTLRDQTRRVVPQAAHDGASAKGSARLDCPWALTFAKRFRAGGFAYHHRHGGIQSAAFPETHRVTSAAWTSRKIARVHHCASSRQASCQSGKRHQVQSPRQRRRACFMSREEKDCNLINHFLGRRTAPLFRDQRLS